MPTPDSSALLVARFLQSSGYEKSLQVFLEESNLQLSDLGLTLQPGLTIEGILDEKRQFDLSLSLENIAISNDLPAFTRPYPSKPHGVSGGSPAPANVLFVLVVELEASPIGPVLIAATTDRALRIYSISDAGELQLFKSHTHLHPSAILSCAIIRSKWLISSSMSGHVVISEALTGEIISSTKYHEKFAVKVLAHENLPFVVTSGYDNTIILHSITYGTGNGYPVLSEVGRITTLSQPEGLSFVSLPLVGEAIVYARRDSTFLYYHILTHGLPFHSDQNLAPSATSWTTFHAMSIAPYPKHPSLLAVATSSIPIMKVFLVEADSKNILMEVFATAPQTLYSTAVLAWRPNGDGLWLNADDGLLRGLEVKTGYILPELAATDGGEKVRTLWAGLVKGEEVLVTGGFDKQGPKLWAIEE